MRAALYVRISLDRDEDAESPERQLSACEALCRSRGFEVVGTFSDRDRSAFHRVSRPGFEAALEAARAGEFEALVVWKLDRMLRRFTDLGPILRTLEEAKVTLVSCVEQIDTSTPIGGALVGFLIAQAEQESRNTSVRVQLAEAAAAKRGEAHTGGSRCFGYERDMTLRLDEADAGREMVARVIAGESCRSIALDLGRRGIMTTAGKPWSAGSLGRWVRSPRIAGLRGHRGVELPGSWEPLVEPDARLEAMRAIAERGRRGTSSKPAHLLTGLVYCSLCGQHLRYLTRVDRKYTCYTCLPAPGSRNCGKIAASATGLEAWVVGELLDFLSEAEAEPLPDDRRAGELRRALEGDEAAMLELVRERFIGRTIDAETFETVRGELQGRIESATSTLQAWERAAEARVTILRPGDRASLEAWWLSHGLADRRVVLGHAVEWVKVRPAPGRGNVFDGRARVRIKFSDAVYRRADAWWTEHLGRDLTDTEVDEARQAWERLPR